MGNLSYVTSRKTFHMGEVLSVAEHHIKNIGCYKYITFGFSKDQIDLLMQGRGFSIFKENKNRLSFNYPRGDFLVWVKFSLEHEMAVYYNGWVSDEGIPEVVRAVGTYPDYKKWASDSLMHVSDSEAFQSLLKLKLADDPRGK